MTEVASDWLAQRLREEQRHRTVNSGRILACPKHLKTIGFSGAFEFCPLCGTKLENPTKISNDNLVWDY